MSSFGNEFNNFDTNLGFKVINLSTPKNSCSGILFSTKDGCKAVTNYHCIKDVVQKDFKVVLKPFGSHWLSFLQNTPHQGPMSIHNDFSRSLVKSLFKFGNGKTKFETVQWMPHLPGPPRFITRPAYFEIESQVIKYDKNIRHSHTFMFLYK